MRSTLEPAAGPHGFWRMMMIRCRCRSTVLLVLLSACAAEDVAPAAIALQDGNARIYVGHLDHGRVGAIDPNSHEVDYYPVGAGRQEKPWRLAVGCDGEAWVASTGPSSASITQVSDAGARSQSVDADIDLRAIGVDPDGVVWAAGPLRSDRNRGRLLRIDPNACTPEGCDFEPHELDVSPTHLEVDSRGLIWLLTNDGFRGIAAFDPSSEDLRGPWPFPAYDGLAIDRAGNVWGGGLHRLDRERFDAGEIQVDYFAAGPVLPVASAIRGIAVDPEGFIWSAASNANGVLKFDPSSESFVSFFPTCSNPNGVSFTENAHPWVICGSGMVQELDENGNVLTTVETLDRAYSTGDSTGVGLRQVRGGCGPENQVLDLPYTRSPTTHVGLNAESLARAQRSFADGGLSPGQESDYTISLWFRFDRKMGGLYIHPNTQREEVNLLTVGDFFQLNGAAKDLNRGVDLFVNDDRNLHLTAPYGQTHNIPEDWAQLTFVFVMSDPEPRLDYYMNGRFAYSQPYTRHPDIQGIVDKLTIGAGTRRNVAFGSSLGMMVDSLALYDAALTTEEVATVYSARGSEGERAHPSIRALWTFERDLQDEVSGFELEPSEGDSDVAVIGQRLPELAYEAGNESTYFPYIEAEAVLFEYLRQLTSDASNFEVETRPTQDPSTLTALLAERGLVNGAYTVDAFRNFVDTLRIPADTFTTYADENGRFFAPVTSSLAAQVAYFYTLDESWNPYRPSGGYPQRDQLRNRIVVNAIIELLHQLRHMHEDQKRGNVWFSYRALVLGYTLYSIDKLMLDPGLPSQVRQAFYETLDYAFRLFIKNSTADDPWGFGGHETDLNLGGFEFIQRLVALDDRLARSDERAQAHIEIRNELGRYFTTLRTYPQIESSFEVGFASSGLCLMDQSHNASYQGTCEDMLHRHIAVVGELLPDDPEQLEDGPHTQFLTAARATAAQATETAAFMNLYDLRLGPTGRFVSDASFSNRHYTGNDLAERPFYEPYLVSYQAMSDDHRLRARPQIWRDIQDLAALHTTTPDFDAMRTRLRQRIESRLTQVPTDGARYVVLTEDNVWVPAGIRSWGYWFRLTAVEHMPRHDLLAEFEDQRSTLLFPSQDATRPYFRQFGSEGEEALHAVHRPRYGATFYTGHSLGQAGHRTKGSGGGGIGAFVSRMDDRPTESMVPIWSGYLGSFQRSGITAICRDTSGSLRPNQGSQDPDCVSLEHAGYYNVLEWPVHTITGIPAGVDDAGVTPDVTYSAVYYDAQSVSTQRDGVDELTIQTPFYRTYGHLCLVPAARPEWCEPGPRSEANMACGANPTRGACLERNYRFEDEFMTVNTRLFDFADEQTQAAFDDPEAVIYDVLPIFFAAYGYDPTRPSETPSNEFFQSVAEFDTGAGWMRIAPDTATLDNVRRVRIRQDVLADGEHHEGGFIIELGDDPVRLRLDSIPVRQPRASMRFEDNRWRQMHTKNLLIEVPRVDDQDASFGISYRIRP